MPTGVGWALRAGFWALCIILGLVAIRSDATAHDLAIDQLVLWPDTARRSLRGEVTFDPELTRSKDAVPTPEHEPKVLALLRENLRYEVDGRALHVDYEIRELWVRGGATAGDLVVFSASLPRGAREIRVFAGPAFKALVVSVLVATPENPSEASSWLVSRGEWTPSYRLAAPPREAGWRSGGAEQFTPPEAVDTPLPRAAEPSVAVSPLPVPTENGADSAAPASASGLAWRFIALGFEHILPDGVDHMLFVAGLVLGAARRTRHVLISLTLFTLAHTVTLGLGNVSGLHFPSGVVEPLIALSIALVGLDNLRQARAAQPPLPNWRYGVVFAFGLVHGMGFANALTELSIDRRQLLVALFSFNLGVELGQLAVVTLLCLALYGVPDKYLRRYVIIPGSALIVVIGILFALQRLLSFG